MNTIKLVSGAVVVGFMLSGCGTIADMDKNRWDAYAVAKQEEWKAKSALMVEQERTKQLNLTLGQASAAAKIDPAVAAIQMAGSVVTSYGPGAEAQREFVKTTTPMPEGMVEGTMKGVTNVLNGIAPYALGMYATKVAVGAVQSVSEKALDRPMSHNGDTYTVDGDIKDSRNTQQSISDGEGATSGITGRTQTEAPPVVEEKPAEEEKPAVEEKPAEEGVSIVEDKPAVEEKPVVEDKPANDPK